MGVKDDNHPLFQREMQIREDQHILFCYVSGSVPTTEYFRRGRTLFMSVTLSVEPR